MLIKRASDLTYADVTPRGLFRVRRNFLLGLVAAGGAVLGWKKLRYLVAAAGTGSVPVKLNDVIKGPYNTDEKPTSYNDVTHYNNFYEFGTDKSDPAANAGNFKASPWTVSVEGEVAKPRKFTMEEIMKLAPLEERIYRHRCVEAWSIVVPWIGYSFSALAKLVEPTSQGALRGVRELLRSPADAVGRGLGD